jgi:hypothetical protein
VDGPVMRWDEYNKDLNFLIIADELADTVHVNFTKIDIRNR